jgi:ribosome-associated protein
MSDDSLLAVDEQLAIPRAELSYQATRSGGPGGQHVNTSSTRVELTWNVAGSAALTDAQRERIMMKLPRRIDKEGVLRLVSGASRSQHQNREDVTERLRRMIAAALKEPKPRRRTKPPRAAREKRLEQKKRRSDLKRRRGPVAPED